MIEFDNTLSVATPDPLFLERLHAFLEKSLTDIKGFSERENRPLEEVLRCSLIRSSLELKNWLFVDPTTCSRMALQLSLWTRISIGARGEHRGATQIQCVIFSIASISD